MGCQWRSATVGGDFDLPTEQGQYYARLEAARSRREVQRKSARQKAANRQRAAAGKPWMGRTFGYNGNTVVPHEAEAIRSACHAVLGGGTLHSIAKEWNAKGLKTSKGYAWEGSSIRQMLLRPTIAGLAVYDGEVLEDVEPDWPAIVERDTSD